MRATRYAVAVCSLGAGVGHVLAARDHIDHTNVVVFFAALALGQLLWALFVIGTDDRRIVAIGAAANVGVILLWLVSRTTGTPFVPGHSGPEPIETLDFMTTLLEVIAVGGSVYLLDVSVRASQFAAGALAFGLIGLGLPPLVARPDVAHGHIAGHSEALHDIAHGRHAAATHDAHDQIVHAAHTGAHATRRTHAAHASPHAHAAALSGSVVARPPLRGVLATVKYGPFTVQPTSNHSDLQNIVRTRLEVPCSSCYLTALQPDLVYTDGSSANFDTGMMLHHAVIGDAAKVDATCGRDSAIAWMGGRFFASGNERTKAVLPAPYGYEVGPSDWWTGVFDIMNFEQVPQTVWFKLSVRYVNDAVPVTPVWLDENNCGNSQYSVPAGPDSRTWDWRSALTGRVVFAGGHVHNWGRYITLSNASTSQAMCKSVAGYGNDPSYEGNIDSMSVCEWDRIGTVRKGETLRIDAYYDAPEPKDDVMGIVLAFVYETDDLKGGSPAPSAMTNPSSGSGEPHPTHDH